MSPDCVVRGLVLRPDQPYASALALADVLAGLLAPLAYVCAENADWPHQRPSRPRPTKTKRGWRLFEPDRTAVRVLGTHLQLPEGSSGQWVGGVDAEDRYRYRWEVC